MFDIRSYYKKENDKVRDSYEQTLEKIKKIKEKEIKSEDENKTKYLLFIKYVARKILQYAKLEKKLGDQYFKSRNFDDLLKENNKLFSELLPENYKTSYANPTYCASSFGDGFAQLISYFYARIRNYKDYAFTHRIYKMEEWNKVFLEFSDFINSETDLELEKMKKLLTQLEFADRTRDYAYDINSRKNPDYRFYTDIIMNDDLTDLRYLFKTGQYISKNEIRMARFMSSYPDDKIATLAQAIVKAFTLGFKRDGKDISKKSVIELFNQIGMEKLNRKVIQEIQKINMKVVIGRVMSSPVNRQFQFDHQFDYALYTTTEWTELLTKCYGEALEQNKDLLSEIAGPLVIMNFGEKPFNPEKKKELLKLSEEQTKIYKKLDMDTMQLFAKYQNRADTSFSIIAFPSPEIGEKFEEIFEATIEVNMIDTDKIEGIQQLMIDVLDQAEKVHVKGKADNQTDLIIKLQELQNPDEETNFMNSGSNVNVPAGEIFTSPQLKGTNGVLHVEETFQQSKSYQNLKITFKDGYVEDYRCTNFETDKENKEYIEENLLFPHKTLPIGEFAIGTNTLAYVFGRKYNILDVLPILITEKTAPHFAIGDTCYARGEDVERRNRYNNKLITACDNEKSILRKSDNPQDAYTNIHNDIVLPFDSIKFITAIMKDGKKIEIIKDGLFVLKGTEELNKPLIEYRKDKA